MSIKSIFAYSFQSFYLAGSFLLLFIFLPSFYNLSLGFALSTLGLIILVSRFFDVFSDIYIGYQTERRVINHKSKKKTNSIWGFNFYFFFDWIVRSTTFKHLSIYLLLQFSFNKLLNCNYSIRLYCYLSKKNPQ